jgi:hypothetical protein
MSSLRYDDYNENSFVIYGDREKFTKAIRLIGGRWNSKLKNGPGWTILKDKEDALKKLIQSIGGDVRDKQLDIIKQNIKHRKQQKKYHRAVSESSSEEGEPVHDSNSLVPVTPVPVTPVPVTPVPVTPVPVTPVPVTPVPVTPVPVTPVPVAQSQPQVVHKPRAPPKKVEPVRKHIKVASSSSSEESSSESSTYSQEKVKVKSKKVSRNVHPPTDVKHSAEDELLKERKEKEKRKFEQEKINFESKQKASIVQSRRGSPPLQKVRDTHTPEVHRNSKETRDKDRKETRDKDRKETRDKDRKETRDKDRKETRKERMRSGDPKETRKERMRSGDRKEVRDSGKIRHTGNTSSAGSIDDKMKYYQSFAKKNDTFRALYEPSGSDSFSSSSEEESSSDDDYPTPESPKRRHKTREHSGDRKLYNKVKDLQKQLYEMQSLSQKK